MQPEHDEARALFDAEWYLATYPDAAGQDLYEHFQRTGEARGYDPNPLFSTSWYLARYPEVAVEGGHALADYVAQGAAIGRDPGPLFCTRWYLRTVPDLKELGQNPLAYYLERGFRELYDPSPVFDSAWYFGAYPDAAGQGFDALLHFLHAGASLGYSPCEEFDLRWYLETYPEVATSGMNPLLHYLLEGAARGFDPNPHFSSNRYLHAHPEARASGENPLVDYLCRIPDRRKKGGTPYRPRPSKPSEATIADARELVDAFSGIEPDLAALPTDLTALRLTDYTPGPTELAWRRFYLSLYDLPRTVVLVGSIDGTPNLAAILDDTRGLLVVETDAQQPSVAEHLPPRTPWRSFVEFCPDLNDEHRLRLTSALVNGLQPDLVVIWGSRSGWEMLRHYGRAIGRITRIVVVDEPISGETATDLMRRYLRHHAPILAGILSADPERLQAEATAAGITSKDRAKIGPIATLSALSLVVTGKPA